MNPEKHNLVQSLIDDQEAAQRDAILRSGGRILRRRRWKRAAWRGMAGMAVAALAFVSIQKMTAPRPQMVAAAPVKQAPTGALTDAQLLAMFPNTPVGLITLKNGQKRLIFPRPGDEQRYVAQSP